MLPLELTNSTESEPEELDLKLLILYIKHH